MVSVLKQQWQASSDEDNEKKSSSSSEHRSPLHHEKCYLGLERWHFADAWVDFVSKAGSNILPLTKLIYCSSI